MTIKERLRFVPMSLSLSGQRITKSCLSILTSSASEMIAAISEVSRPCSRQMCFSDGLLSLRITTQYGIGASENVSYSLRATKDCM